MDKIILLQNLKSALVQGVVSPSDVRSVLATQEAEAHESAEGSKSFSVSGILYYIGGGIAFLGVSIFVGQHWDDLSSILRILVTLGSGLALFAAATVLETTKKLDRVPDAFHFLAGLLIPGGIFVTLYELEFRGGDFGPGIIFFCLTALYVLAYRFYRHNIILAFGLLYGTMAYFLLTNALMGDAPAYNMADYWSYRIVALGASYTVLGYAFASTVRKPLSSLLYFLGTLSVLGGAMALQGFTPTQSAFWEIIYPGLVFGAMFLSIHLRSRLMLFLGALFLIGDIFKITDEYFRDSLSWPLMLVMAGFLLIGVGYTTFYLNNKYLKAGA